MKNDRHTRAGSRRAIFRCITTCYNRKRRHYTLCYIGLSRVRKLSYKCARSFSISSASTSPE